MDYYVYQDNLDALVRSIGIKSSHQATLINQNLISIYGVNYVSEDPTTWRYYMNLNGEYHSSNDEILMYVTEVDSVIALSKSVLELYPDTRDKLMLFSNDYLALVNKYPREETLIKGMLMPVDYTTALQALDGTILSYDSAYIEINELELMNRLSTYTYGLYHRWFNPHYLETDPLYLGVFLAFIYSNLATKIDAMRLENVHTHKAHSFHIEQFFSNNLDLDTQYMNTKSKLWLYQNLRAVMTNNGKADTLHEIIDNVLTENRVGVGALAVRRVAVNELTQSIPYASIPQYEKIDDNVLNLEAINSAYEDRIITLPDLIDTEISNGYIHNTAFMERDELVYNVDNEIDDNTDILSASKVLHLTGVEDRDIMPNPRINLIIDNLVYLTTTGTLNYIMKYTDNNTNIIYELNASQSVRLLVSLLLRYGGVDNPTSAMLRSESIIKDVDPTTYQHALVDDSSDYYYVDVLNTMHPPSNAVFSIKGVVAYLTTVINYFSAEWLFRSGMDNRISIGNLDLVSSQGNNMDLPIDLVGVEDEIGFTVSDDYDYYLAIMDLIRDITGGSIELDVNDDNRAAIESYADALRKTTSYHLQIITDGDTRRIVDIYNEGLGGLVGAPVITVESSYFNGLEDITGNLEDSELGIVANYSATRNYYLLESELNMNIGTAIIPNVSTLTRQPKLRDFNTGTVDYYRSSMDTVLLESSLDMNVGSALITPRSTLIDTPVLTTKSVNLSNSYMNTLNTTALPTELNMNIGTAVLGLSDLAKAPNEIVMDIDMLIYAGGKTVTKTIHEGDKD